MSLPITLLAGPSTALRDDLVRCLVLRRPDLVAVTYDVAPAPDGLHLIRRVVDARSTHQHLRVPLTGCCLSCTVATDAEPALELVARSGRWREAVLALPASLQPAPVADALRGHDDVHVDTVTTVVDALLLREQLTGDDLLVERGLAAAPGDRRSTAELVVTQLEEADVLAVADLHRIDTATARTVEALLAHLSPLALQVPLGPGGVGADDVVGTGRRDRAATAGDRARLAWMAGDLCPPACGVTTVRWRSDRPLQPARLHETMPALLPGVVRSHGHVWLADRLDQRIVWNSAGGTLSFADPLRWHGTPGCELALTGVDLDADVLRARLEHCLATDAELAAEPTWEDPFGRVLGPASRSAPR